MLSFSRDPQTTVNRTIHVPNSNKGLFIPVMSVIVSACETSAQLIPTANQDQSSIFPPSLSLELDGTPLTTLPSYIFVPADVGTFKVNFPSSADAIFKINNSGPCDAVVAGRYIWTEPLSSGDHEVHFKGHLQCNGSTCIDPEYIEDITYKITVP